MAPDVEGEAARFLHWAETEEWSDPRSHGKPLSATMGFGPIYASSINGNPDDPWMAALDTGNEDFCEVPTTTLGLLRRVGEAQLSEIVKLREEVGEAQERRDNIAQMEALLRELETNFIVTSNEVDLRRLEIKHLESEVERLTALHEERATRAKELRLQNEQMEKWLTEPLTHQAIAPNRSQSHGSFGKNRGSDSHGSSATSLSIEL